MTTELSATANAWPKKPGHYWIRLGGDEFAQPCFYDPKTRMVLLCGSLALEREEIGWAVISDKPMPKTTIVPRRKK